MSIGIYKITNPKDNMYIGQSQNIEKRFRQYKNVGGAKYQTILYRSFQKYGVDNHIFEIIEVCELSQLNERECFYIEKYDTWRNDDHMNCRAGGVYGKHSEHSKELNRQKHLGKKHSPESIAKIKVHTMARIGKKRDPEIGKKISAAKKGIKFSSDHVAKLTASFANSESRKESFRQKSLNQGRVVINTETGATYHSAVSAALNEGHNRHTLTNKLNGTYYNNTFLKYL